MDDDLGEGLHRRAAEIQRGLDQILVHLLELRHDVQDDVGEIERDMRDKKRPEAEYGIGLQHCPRERKQQRQRDAGDDIRVRHGDVGHGHDGGAEPALHAMDADGGHRADDGRDERGEQRDDDRVAQQRQERAVAEQIGILPQRKALEAGDVRAGIERGHGQNDHRDVEEDEDQNGNGTVDVLHTLMTSSPSPSPKRFITATQMKIRIMRTRLMAAPRFGL